MEMGPCTRRTEMYAFSPAPNLNDFLKSSSNFQQVIISILGVPGCLLAGWAVELPNFGRRGTLAISSGKRMCPFPVWSYIQLLPA